MGHPLDHLLAAFASAFSQDTRLLTLQLGDGARWDQTLLPLSVDGAEGINQPYRYTVTCLSPDAAVELKTLLGLPARLAIQDAEGSEVMRGGVVTRAEALGADGGFARYALTVEPPAALLKLRKTSRVFQDLSVDAIVQTILDEHAAANPVFARQQRLEFQLAKDQPKRSYCLQYRESDYDFIVRLLHEEGICWRWDHIDDTIPQVKLIAFDDAASVPPAALERVRFHRSDATEDEDGLTAWGGARQVVSGAVSLASYDYKPVATLAVDDASAVEQGQDGKALQSTLEDYDPQGLYYAQDGEQLARYVRLGVVA